MFDEFQYVAILKGRLGEYGALEELSSNLKKFVAPVIEIPPIDWDHKLSQPAKTLDQHLQKVGPNLARAWGPGEPVFLDLMWISESGRLANGIHLVDHVFAATRAHGLSAIPVTGLARDSEYQKACQRVVQQDGWGVCIRLQKGLSGLRGL